MTELCNWEKHDNKKKISRCPVIFFIDSYTITQMINTKTMVSNNNSNRHILILPRATNNSEIMFQTLNYFVIYLIFYNNIHEIVAVYNNL